MGVTDAVVPAEYVRGAANRGCRGVLVVRGAVEPLAVVGVVRLLKKEEPMHKQRYRQYEAEQEARWLRVKENREQKAAWKAEQKARYEAFR